MHLLDVRSSLNILDTLIAPSALVTETSRVLKYLLGRVTSKGEPSKKRKLNPVKDAIAPIPVQGSHQAKNSLDNSDLAYLLSSMYYSHFFLRLDFFMLIIPHFLP